MPSSFLMQHGTNSRGPVPWEIPYWMPDYMIFFGVLYLVVAALGIGLALVTYKTIKDVKNPSSHH